MMMMPLRRILMPVLGLTMFVAPALAACTNGSTPGDSEPASNTQPAIEVPQESEPLGSESAQSESPVEPEQLQEPAVPLDASIGGANSYLLGDLVRYGVSLRNTSPGPITIDPWPPAWWVRCVDRDVIVYSSEAGTGTSELWEGYPGPPTFGHWWQDEEVNEGQKILPGLYEIVRQYVVFENSTGKTYTVTVSFQFEIVAQTSAKTGELAVNQSATSEGMTVTLQRIEMDAVEVLAFTFTRPPDYELPQGGPPHEYRTFGTHSRAEYSADGAAPAQLKGSGAKLTKDGITLIWDGIEPIPVDAKEFTFVVTQLGDVEGRWEFRVRLD